MSQSSNSSTNRDHLILGFHGRIIDHLGIQMYQSPTAALAEIVSNAWDADATSVDIDFDFSASQPAQWKISITDTGTGMTRDECQAKFLNVGYDRRAGKADKAVSSEKKRPLMGRKGIGKFAGFGIARYIRVDTVSAATKEHTIFELDRETIRKGDSYVDNTGLTIDIIPSEPGTHRERGTIITLSCLQIAKRIPVDQFRASLARRFILNTTADEFIVKVDGAEIADNHDADIEMSFPRDFAQKDKDERSVSIDGDGWGTEILPGGRAVTWRIHFFKELIKDKELAGITIFAHKKLAQRPFMFNITGGMASQAGPEYMSGKVIADWVDELGEDVISPERQRIRWEHEETEELRKWGETLVRRLMSVWKEKRGQAKVELLNSKISSFADRLEALGSEAATVKRALTKLAEIEKLSTEQFEDLGTAILRAWEGGRLRGLIHQIANTEQMDETQFLKILTEANAITALHSAETINAKIQAIEALEKRVRERNWENSIRDFIAKNPWLISPRWETFAKETRLSTICKQSAKDAYKDNNDFDKRVDLVLSADQQLLVLEFMRPGIKLDWDHISRFEMYTNVIQSYVQTNTALGLKTVSGYLVADKLADRPGNDIQIQNMNNVGRYVMDWASLIAQAKHQWREFLDNVKERTDDVRLQAIGVDTADDEE